MSGISDGISPVPNFPGGVRCMSGPRPGQFSAAARPGFSGHVLMGMEKNAKFKRILPSGKLT